MSITAIKEELIKRIPKMESEINTASDEAIIFLNAALKLSKEDRKLLTTRLNTEIEGREIE